jgi:hypothetical protein
MHLLGSKGMCELLRLDCKEGEGIKEGMGGVMDRQMGMGEKSGEKEELWGREA